MNARISILAANYLLLLLAGGCGGQLYKVAPLPSGSLPPFSAVAGGESRVGAVALDGDRSLEQFEANLPMAGVLAVEVRVGNPGRTPLESGALRFELRNGEGAICLPLTPEKALGRVMKFYGNNFYPIDSRRATEESYRGVAFGRMAVVPPGGEHRGFLFFSVAREAPPARGYTLGVRGAGEDLTIPLTMRR